jgi:hypothetical protein
MVSDYLKHSRSLDEVYALIDKNRVDAAGAVRAKFHNDMEAAITTIASIGAIASARVQADSRVASAKVLINAELAATRLLAEAELQASRCAQEAAAKPRAVVEAAMLEIGRHTSLGLIAAAKDSVERIQQDAEAAIKVLRETGAIAIREIQALGTNVAEHTRHAAELAAERLKEYRRQAHTPDQACDDAADLASMVSKAAEASSLRLQDAIKATLADINATTDAACAAVQAAAVAAEAKIIDGHARASARLKETLAFFTAG